MARMKRASSIKSRKYLKRMAQKETAIDAEAVLNRSGYVQWGDKTGDNHEINENPDILVQRKGLRIYDYMDNDDQLHSLAAIKKVAVLARDFEIQAASSSDRDKHIQEFVKWSLFKDMDVPIRELIYNFLTAMDYGYSVSEKVMKYNATGQFRGLVSYKDIAPKSPHGFLFQRDDYGRLLSLVQNTNEIAWANWTNLKEKMSSMPKLPLDKFVVFSYNSKFRNPFGISDFRAAYRGWISKDIILKFMNKYLENYATPVPVGTIPSGTDPDDVTDLKNVLSHMDYRSAITIPEGVSVDYLESKRTANPAFLNAVGMYNGAMSRASLVPDLMGFSGGTEGGGSYGLGSTQYDVFTMYLEYLGALIEDVVFFRQIIKPLVDLNFPGVKEYPRFKFSSIKRESRKDRAMILKSLVDAGVINKIQPWMFQFVGLPIQTSEISEMGDKIELPGGRTPIETRTDRDLGKRTVVDDNNPNEK